MPTLLEGEEAGASSSDATTMSYQAAGGEAGEQPPSPCKPNLALKAWVGLSMHEINWTTLHTKRQLS